MEITALESPFQFIDNRIVSLSVKNGHLKDLNDPNLARVIEKLDYTVTDFKELEDGYFGTLLFAIKVNAKLENKTVYSINLEVEGAFGGLNKFGDKNSFLRMLELNGSTSLLSIARSIIITVSSLSTISGQIRIPLINMLSLYEEKHKSEEKDILEDIPQ
jgi:preprotein translocase subunit SecB